MKEKKIIKVLKTDRNEVRYHVHSDSVTVLYKNQKGLAAGYEVAMRIMPEKKAR